MDDEENIKIITFLKMILKKSKKFSQKNPPNSGGFFKLFSNFQKFYFSDSVALLVIFGFL